MYTWTSDHDYLVQYQLGNSTSIDKICFVLKTQQYWGMIMLIKKTTRNLLNNFWIFCMRRILETKQNFLWIYIQYNRQLQYVLTFNNCVVTTYGVLRIYGSTKPSLVRRRKHHQYFHSDIIALTFIIILALSILCIIILFEVVPACCHFHYIFIVFRLLINVNFYNNCFLVFIVHVLYLFSI